MKSKNQNAKLRQRRSSLDHKENEIRTMIAPKALIA